MCVFFEDVNMFANAAFDQVQKNNVKLISTNINCNSVTNSIKLNYNVL